MISKSKVQEYIIYTIVAITAIQYSAIGINEDVYNYLRSIITLILVLTILINAKGIVNGVLKENVILVHFISAIIFIAVISLLIITGSKVTVAPLREFIICLLFVSIGHSLNLTDMSLYRIFNFLVIAFTLAALSIILNFSVGLQIPETYLPIPKNQFSPVFSVALILSLYHWGSRTKPLKIILSLCFITLLFSLLLIRSRSSILATTLVVFIYTTYYLPAMKYKFYAYILIFIAAIILSPKLYDAFFLNYDVDDIDSLSAGRVNIYSQGLDFLIDNPLGGALQENYISNSNIHNYLLYNLVNYGVLISFGLIVTYFYYILISIKAFKSNTFKIYESAPLMIFIIYISSLFEYSFPFGPGTAVLFPFLFLGVYLRRRNGY